MENATTFWKTICHCLTMPNTYPVIRQSHSMYLSKRNNLYTNVYRGFVHNHSKLETIQIHFGYEWINKMWYSHTYPGAKQIYPHTQDVYIVVSKKPGSKGYILHDCIYITSVKGTFVVPENRSVDARG